MSEFVFAVTALRTGAAHCNRGWHVAPALPVRSAFVHRRSVDGTPVRLPAEDAIVTYTPEMAFDVARGLNDAADLGEWPVEVGATSIYLPTADAIDLLLDGLARLRSDGCLEAVGDQHADLDEVREWGAMRPWRMLRATSLLLRGKWALDAA